MENINNPNIKFYDVDWVKVRTIKDLKLIMKVLVTKLRIDENSEEDIAVYESLKHILIESTDENIG